MLIPKHLEEISEIIETSENPNTSPLLKFIIRIIVFNIGIKPINIDKTTLDFLKF